MRDTKRKWRQLAERPAGDVCREAAGVLSRGGLVVFPTETFYGIAALPSHAEALARLVALKERDGKKPIPLVAASRADVEGLGEIPAALLPLVEKFWPGPLTIAVVPRALWPAVLFAGGRDLGVRVSGHAWARELAGGAGGLITSTSANLAGRPAVTMPAALDRELVAAVDLVVDAGECRGGSPSTIVGLGADGKVELRREGAISLAQLAAVLGEAPLVSRVARGHRGRP